MTDAEREPTKVPEWQPIETAPWDGEFLVWHRDRIRQVQRYTAPLSQDDGVVIDSMAGRIWVATHWMPLPEAPK